MISITPIACANVERCAYIFYCDSARGINKCIGKFIEQENDAGEIQYLFIFFWDRITEEDLRYIIVPGIDLEQKLSVYVRSYEIPYFVESATLQEQRGDLPLFLEAYQMDFYDRFEFMLRTRAVTHHSNCYLGRTVTDFYDADRWRVDPEFRKATLPNLAEVPENVFHAISGDNYGLN